MVCACAVLTRAALVAYVLWVAEVVALALRETPPAQLHTLARRLTKLLTVPGSYGTRTGSNHFFGSDNLPHAEGYREKRPQGGVLGLDNPDFITSTLDKVRVPEVTLSGPPTRGRHRSRTRVRPSRGPITTLTVAPTAGLGRMSSSLSVKDLRRMLASVRDLRHAGR